MGKGEYYKNKYGGGGKGRSGGGKGKGGGGKGKGGGGNNSSQDHHSQQQPLQTQSAAALTEVLRRIDGAGYKAYHDIKGCWQFEQMSLFVDYAQSDPFAMPSRIRVRVPMQHAAFPGPVYSSRIRRVALCDYITRSFHRLVSSGGHDIHHESGSYSGEKGGEITVDNPGQHVLERTSVVVTDDFIECRMTCSLPARGRSVLGQWANQILTETVPRIAREALFWDRQAQGALQDHITSVEDQQALRDLLLPNELIAFVANGAILPRTSGDSDTAMQGASVVPFKAPASTVMSFALPSGRVVEGMPIRRGITLIVGGGFHGKSTLLQALEVGVYNHCSGDGREFVVTEPSAVKIRAEDGRACHCVDIRPFINNLPYDKSTQQFSTPDASGSTSQAANIIEAIEAGSRTLLLDEDTCATNFMIRDHRMQLLIAKQHEPITPFIYKAGFNPQLQRLKVLCRCSSCMPTVECRLSWCAASVLMTTCSVVIESKQVTGGAGDYFDVAHSVVLCEGYLPHDATAEAKQIATQLPSQRVEEGGASFGVITTRQPLMDSLSPFLSEKIKVRDHETAQVGDITLDLSGVEQLVEKSQTRAVMDGIRWVRENVQQSATIAQCLQVLDQAWDQQGLDALSTQSVGNYARPRSFEVAAALNRLRFFQCRQ